MSRPHPPCPAIVRSDSGAETVMGSFVMIFDPIFQGLAIAMMFGAVAATGLTLVVIPLLYFEFFRNKKSAGLQ